MIKGINRNSALRRATSLLCHFGLLMLVLLVAFPAFAKDPVTIYLAGDSTMAQKEPNRRPETGWGEELQKFFDEKKIRIENHAKNGRSTRSFISEGLWQELVNRLKKGDYVFIEFGHNDESKSKGDRYSTPQEFRANLLRFVNEARAKGANPILLTPVERRSFDAQGVLKDTHGEYPDIVRAAAAEARVPLIDMQRKSQTVLKQYGPEGSRRLFLQLKPGENPNYPKGIEDNTHFSPLGADAMAQLAVEAIREQHLKLTKYLKEPEKVISSHIETAVIPLFD